MKILYLDDSGKVHGNDPSKVAVFSGFSVDMEKWHRINRQIAGAKARLMPGRAAGDPNKWEIKSGDFLTVEAWNRAKNRKFCMELASILSRNQCKIFSISLEKSKVRDVLKEEKFVPLMIQRVVTIYYDQLKVEKKYGVVVCDWSTYQMDQHIASCVGAMAASRSMELLVGGVNYASSLANMLIQVADIIASCMRRDAEGQPHVLQLSRLLKSIEYENNEAANEIGIVQPVKGIAKIC